MSGRPMEDARRVASEQHGRGDDARAELAELQEKVAQLETALQSRIVIEQAKGILAERLSIDVDEAFGILRYAARSHRLNLHAVATRVVTERETPTPVIVAIARSQRARAAWMREITEAHQARLRELQLALAQQVERLEELRPRRPL